MDSVTCLLCCWAVLLLHWSPAWTTSAGVRYREVGSDEAGQRSMGTTRVRFTRAENNVTRDYHTYYTSTYYPPTSSVVNNLWKDLASMVDSGVVVDDFTVESELSGLHRYYEVHDLKFKFPFYGHTLERIAVTTGGFLYTGDILHDQVALTQFIAPLQADFNPNHTDSGRVLVLSADDRFTVQWDKVHNHDHQNDGAFTFQVSIFPSGVIHFVYQEVPLLLDDIDNEGHPVEVGLADAFYVYQDVRVGTLVHVYEYDRISLNSSRNLTSSAYVLFPVLNCVSATSCEQCANVSSVSNFDCVWCGELDRCSDGFDRFRQDWFESGCSQKQETSCKQDIRSSPTPTIGTTTATITTSHTSFTNLPKSSSRSSGLTTGAKAGIGVSIAVLLLLLLGIIVAIGLILFVYAYRTPSSKMGQYLIKYRPKARSLNKSSNAASYDVSSEKANLESDMQ